MLQLFLLKFLFAVISTKTSYAAAIESQQGILAKAAATSPNGVVAGYSVLNGVRFPIVAFLNEQSYQAFREKMRRQFSDDMHFIEQGTLQSQSFVITPKIASACSSCLNKKQKQLTTTLEQATVFSWIETPDIHIAYGSPLASIVAATTSSDPTIQKEIESRFPGAVVKFSQSYNFPSRAVKSFSADLPLAVSLIRDTLLERYRSEGWKILTSSPNGIKAKKSASLIAITIESLSENLSRILSYEIIGT